MDGYKILPRVLIRMRICRFPIVTCRVMDLFLVRIKTSWHSGLPIGQKMRLDRHLHQRNRNSCYLSRSVLSVPNPTVIDSYRLDQRKLLRTYIICESQNLKILSKYPPSKDCLPSSLTCDFWCAALHRRSDMSH